MLRDVESSHTESVRYARVAAVVGYEKYARKMATMAPKSDDSCLAFMHMVEELYEPCGNCPDELCSNSCLNSCNLMVSSSVLVTNASSLTSQGRVMQCYPCHVYGNMAWQLWLKLK